MNREPRVTTIEGRRVLVVERRPPLPASLATLLGSIAVTFSARPRLSGTRTACQSEQDHRLVRFVEGSHRGMDGVTRDLRLLMCADCESVQVRDVSVDTLFRLRVGTRGPARRDHVIAWYSGARRNGREYR